ncbi:SGNH/GDSL hydrolase family protein [Rhodococcoides yunnanense]|uniref:SGNH/GDSL hydrolase family protein n=1 Tax=Rhodococcoides yunnanense TaxID=278209 RepID=UPI001FE5A015|nr:SGNH/GDSL hydrolase family protein [Rhodococcus yunnanensis]
MIDIVPRRRVLRLVVVVAVAITTVLTSGNTQAFAAPAPLRVSIVGDSFSAGIGAGDSLGYAPILAARGCWIYNLVAVSGSGYTASPDPFVRLPRVTKAASTIPDVIIIQGSGNDRGDSGLFVAATGLYVAFRAIAPQARIVVVGPTGAPNAKHDNINEVRRHLRDAASVAGVTFVDPQAERWLNAAGDYAPDGIHPNTRGHAQMANRLFDDLTRLGIPRIDSC